MRCMKIDEKRVEMKKLKPCPVCKSQADTSYNTRFNYQAFCTNDECFMSTIIMHDKMTEEEAIETWNKIASLKEVKHGEWVPLENNKFQCSECRNQAVSSNPSIDVARDLHYCWSCGAKMDGKEKK